jgi:hypothetical protein
MAAALPHHRHLNEARDAQHGSTQNMMQGPIPTFLWAHCRQATYFFPSTCSHCPEASARVATFHHLLLRLRSVRLRHPARNRANKSKGVDQARTHSCQSHRSGESLLRLLQSNRRYKMRRLSTRSFRRVLGSLAALQHCQSCRRPETADCSTRLPYCWTCLSYARLLRCQLGSLLNTACKKSDEESLRSGGEGKIGWRWIGRTRRTGLIDRLGLGRGGQRRWLE